jgi:hypothetical protein
MTKAAQAVAEGSGLDLTRAKIVSDQHQGWISATRKPYIDHRARWIFTFQIPAVVNRPMMGTTLSGDVSPGRARAAKRNVIEGRLC